MPPPAEIGRRRNAQQSARIAHRLHYIVGILDGTQQGRDTLVIRRALRRQPECSRGSLKETYAQPSLEARNAFCDRGRARTDHPAGIGKRACLYGSHEGQQARRFLKDRRHCGILGKKDMTNRHLEQIPIEFTHSPRA